MAIEVQGERKGLRRSRARSEEAAPAPARPRLEAIHRGERRTRVSRRRRRRFSFSPLTRRILTLNVVALAILVAGLLYLDQYQEGLVEAELKSLTTQARIFAGALGGAAVQAEPAENQVLVPDMARKMMRRLVAPTRTRARLFAPSGELIADSRVLAGPGGAVQVEQLPPPEEGSGPLGVLIDVYDWLVGGISQHSELPRYRELADQRAVDYDEVMRALAGEEGHAIRVDRHDRLILSVAVPVQRYRQVLGALMVSKVGTDIERALRAVRLDIFKVFAVALAITTLLSLYLASTIVRPIKRLAAAADRVRRGQGREYKIPDFTERGDEVGDLSGALREMTEALWQRMDAIEGFAADVAHEIKNPLTSLRSAVETAARVEDPEQQRRLMAIILEDVQRLDRLISDISDASRLDAELSRARLEPVDIGRMLTTLVDLRRETGKDGNVQLVCDCPDDQDLTVPGIQVRLVQVFENLIANAVSFSPPGGTIRVAAHRENGDVVATVEDEGPGLPEGKAEAIFERFYSERPKGEKFGMHSGLGLSISKQIVEVHRGTIKAENRRGPHGEVIGARFIVRLPAA